MDNQTNKLLSLLPYWMKARQTNDDSNMREFMEVFGKELSDSEELIGYIYDQLLINKADLQYVSKIYKSTLVRRPSDHSQYYAKGDGVLLHRCKTIDELFVSLNDNVYETLNHVAPYFLHPELNEIYFGYKYDSVIFHIDDNVEELIQEDYYVWNPFDELGSLLGLKRIANESNENFRDRIKDTFIHLGGNNREGLINAIGRELDLREKYRWFRTDKELELFDTNILINSLSIIYPDGSIEKPKVYKKDNGNLYLKPLAALIDGVFISYIKDYSIHDMNNKDDEFIQKYYRTDNGVANNRMIAAAKALRKFSYDNFTWDQTFSQVRPVNVLESRYDASKEGFKKFNNMSPSEINKLFEKGDLS